MVLVDPVAHLLRLAGGIVDRERSLRSADGDRLRRLVDADGDMRGGKRRGGVALSEVGGDLIAVAHDVVSRQQALVILARRARPDAHNALGESAKLDSEALGLDFVHIDLSLYRGSLFSVEIIPYIYGERKR